MSDSQDDAVMTVQLNELEPKIQDLLGKAAETRNLAYAPYSNFFVGAAVLCADKDGTIFTGCNVENSTFVAICAERTAYLKAISEGRRKFTAVAVVADSQELTFVSPCGTCRQFMSEFGNVDVYMSKSNLEKIFVTTLDKLLPYQFTLKPSI